MMSSSSPSPMGSSGSTITSVSSHSNDGIGELPPPEADPAGADASGDPDTLTQRPRFIAGAVTISLLRFPGGREPTARVRGPDSVGSWEATRRDGATQPEPTRVPHVHPSTLRISA